MEEHVGDEWEMDVDEQVQSRDWTKRMCVGGSRIVP